MSAEELLAIFPKEQLHEALRAGSLEAFLQLPDGPAFFENYMHAQEQENRKYWECWKLIKELGNVANSRTIALQVARECYVIHIALAAKAENKIDGLSRTDRQQLNRLINQCKEDPNRNFNDILSKFKRVEGLVFEQLDQVVFQTRVRKILTEEVERRKRCNSP